MTQRLKYDALEVRPSFKSTYCRELMLPSGKGSGWYCYPISAEEIISLTADITEQDYKNTTAKECKTISEYLMWVALRLKFGVTYLAPKNGWRLINDDKYVEPAPADIFEKIYEICHATGQQVFDELNSKIIELKYQEKDKKYFDEDLTSPATML